jgi:hypothetical protein
MSTIDTSAVQIGSPAADAIPVTIPSGSVVAQVNGEWNDKGEAVTYSIKADAPQFMAVILLAMTIAGTQTRSPSGQIAYGMNGVGFNQVLTESGEYQITVTRSAMGAGSPGGPFTLVVVLGSS